MIDIYDIARFWSKVNVGTTAACWPLRSGTPYGDFKLQGRATSMTRAAYIFAYGEPPEGAVIRHTCDNPTCCNPRHLITGTHADNVRDRVFRNRSATGERNGRSKLTIPAVQYIRAADHESNTSLAALFKVARKVIRDIRARRTWRSVE